MDHPPPEPSRLRWQPRRSSLAAAVLGIGGVYALGLGSVLFSPEGSKVAVWWPAAGLSVALLVLAPRRWRWVLAVAVVVASGLANYTAGRPPGTSLGFGLSNAAEAFTVAWLLTGGRDVRPALRTMEDLWRLVTATFAGSLVVGLGIGVTAYRGLGSPFLDAAVAVMASHTAAILVLVPLALAGSDLAPQGRRNEAVLQWVLLVGVVTYVFSPGQVLSLTFLPMPLLLWAALRFGLRTVSYQLIVLGLLTTTLTVLGGGPFGQGVRTGVTGAATTASLVQTFLIVTALIALPLAVAVDQRRSALLRVSQSEELFRKTFSESFVGMLLLRLSPQGLRVHELNQTAADILATSQSELEGQLLQPLLDSATALEDVATRMVSGDLAGWREELWLSGDVHRRIGLALSPVSTTADDAMLSAQLIDITDVYDATAHLRSEKDFTAAVLNTTACLIVVVDVDGNLAGLNPAGERATGLAEADVLAMPLWGSLVSAEDEPVMRRLLDRTLPGVETPTHEGDLLTRTGRRRRVVWSSAPLTDEAGRRTHVVLTGIDVTDERNVRSMTNHLLDSATTTAFIGLSRRGRITIFNSGAEELLGHAAAEVVSRASIEDLLDPEEVRHRAEELGTDDGLEAVLAGVASEARTRDWTCVRKDGGRVICSVTLSGVHDAFGAHIGYLAVGRDVTESRRSQRILVQTLEKEREAVERLRDLDRTKNDFVSMVSHELRTPITSIVGYTEMLQDGDAGAVTAAQDRLLDAVRRNGQRLIVLIEDLLTLSRIEAGTFTLHKHVLDLRSVVGHAREALGPLLSDRRLDVTVDLPETAVAVVGDPGQLERVVLNLVGNAVKFTEDGGRVHCALTVDDAHARIEVSDTGIGIPPSEQPALFTRFFRSTTAQERQIPGTGLGLSIVQSIVHSHGGEISISSRHLMGTQVTVSLPLSQVARRVAPTP